MDSFRPWSPRIPFPTLSYGFYVWFHDWVVLVHVDKWEIEFYFMLGDNFYVGLIIIDIDLCKPMTKPLNDEIRMWPWCLIVVQWCLHVPCLQYVWLNA